MYLNLNEDRLKQQNAFETAREITQQPSTWLKSVKIIQALKPQIKAFLALAALDGEFDVVFLGAGTSEYVGNVLALALNPSHNFSLRSVSSTEMVMTPAQLHQPKQTHCVYFLWPQREFSGIVRCRSSRRSSLFKEPSFVHHLQQKTVNWLSWFPRLIMPWRSFYPMKLMIWVLR